MTAEAYDSALARVPWITGVHFLDRVPSTNDEALRLAAEGAPGGTVVVAGEQTAGRGRLGRSWWSEPGTTLAASWLLRPAEAPDRRPLLTLAAGVAVAEAISHLSGIRAELKWPNDVRFGERKLGGILAESRPEAVVIGVGVNLSCEIPAELSQIATSIAAAGGNAPGGPELLAESLARFDHVRRGPILDRYRSLCGTIGLDVRVTHRGGEDVAGVAVDVDDAGALLVRTPSGLVRVAAGDVEHVRPA